MIQLKAVITLTDIAAMFIGMACAISFAEKEISFVICGLLALLAFANILLIWAKE